MEKITFKRNLEVASLQKSRCFLFIALMIPCGKNSHLATGFPTTGCLARGIAKAGAAFEDNTGIYVWGRRPLTDVVTISCPSLVVLALGNIMMSLC